jgi:hypothetical protein
MDEIQGAALEAKLSRLPAWTDRPRVIACHGDTMFAGPGW